MEDPKMRRPYIQEQTTTRTKRYPRGQRFRPFYSDAVGRWVGGKWYPTKREAQAFLDELERQRVTGTLTDTSAGRATFEAVWNERRAREDFAANTIASQDNVWRVAGPALGRRAVLNITPAMVDAVVGQFSGPAAQAKARSVLKAVFEYAVANRRITVNPAKVARKSRTRSARMAARSELSAEDKRRLTANELRALLDAVPDRNRMMVELMARIGLRPGECYALKVEKFDPEARTLRIDETTSEERFTKTGESRTVKLPRIVADRLADHVERYATNGLVFPDRDGTEYTTSGFRSIFQRAAAKVDVNHGYSPRDLRHTAAAFAIAHGANVYHVQNMLGHAKPSITLDVYGFLWDKSSEDLADALDAAIREQDS
jgi:integrase